MAGKSEVVKQLMVEPLLLGPAAPAEATVKELAVAVAVAVAPTLTSHSYVTELMVLANLRREHAVQARH